MNFDWYWTGVAALVTSWSVLDTAATLFAVSHGAKESNPIALALLDKGLLDFVIVKLVLGAAVVIIAVRLETVITEGGWPRWVGSSFFWFSSALTFFLGPGTVIALFLGG